MLARSISVIVGAGFGAVIGWTFRADAPDRSSRVAADEPPARVARAAPVPEPDPIDQRPSSEQDVHLEEAEPAVPVELDARDAAEQGDAADDVVIIEIPGAVDELAEPPDQAQPADDAVEEAETPDTIEVGETAEPPEETEAVLGAPVDVEGVQPAPADEAGFQPSPFAAPPAAAPSAPASCYLSGREQTGLLSSQLSELCEGAPTPSGPVDCYVSAQEENIGVDAQRLSLCRCAVSAEPVDCFVRMRSDTGLWDYQIERLCAPQWIYALLPNCLPQGG